ncbi:lysophospholipase I [Pluteus cervinus]|uniref:Lysophospholipase I n=1 Tax=Pluteus cervinus TaxID=181527 RepID=A0ACD3BI48_9AGAR|nr:lysophospholipase I [Pluteus cervinus]
MDSPQAVTSVAASSNHTGTVIFLHGLGQGTETWKELIIEAFVPHLPHIEWILPQAAPVPVSLNQGQRRPSWFDITQFPPDPDHFDELGTAHSISVIENVILSQVHAGIDPGRIVLLGFSQGAALALMVSLTTLHDLGGVVSLSGWIPKSPRARQLLHSELNFPILFCHGTSDIEVPLDLGRDAVGFLLNSLSGAEDHTAFKTYPGLGHTINDDELDDLVRWLQVNLGP